VLAIAFDRALWLAVPAVVGHGLVQRKQLPVGGAAAQDGGGVVEDDVLEKILVELRAHGPVRTVDLDEMRRTPGLRVNVEAIHTDRAGRLFPVADGIVQPGEDVPARGGHAIWEIGGTVAEMLDTGVIFTAEIRVSLSDPGKPRVLFVTSTPS
jgi:hypothetical protein